MLKNYLKTAFRNYLKNKTTTLITIGGFALSLAVTVILSSYILEELSVNKQLPNLDNIYQVVNSNNDAGIEEVDKDIIKQIPGIDKVSYYSNFGDLPFNQANKTMPCKVVFCEEEFFDIFSVKFLAGNPANIFENRSNVVLSKSFAEKFFGNENPLGQTIKISHNKEFVVAGIFEDLPNNLSIKCDAFCNTQSRVLRQSASYDGVNLIFSRIFIQSLHSNYDLTK